MIFKNKKAKTDTYNWFNILVTTVLMFAIKKMKITKYLLYKKVFAVSILAVSTAALAL